MPVSVKDDQLENFKKDFNSNSNSTISSGPDSDYDHDVEHIIEVAKKNVINNNAQLTNYYERDNRNYDKDNRNYDKDNRNVNAKSIMQFKFDDILALRSTLGEQDLVTQLKYVAAVAKKDGKDQVWVTLRGLLMAMNGEGQFPDVKEKNYNRPRENNYNNYKRRENNKPRVFI